MVGLPRMRGDRPITHSTFHGLTSFTPHARGSTRDSLVLQDVLRVYPACAGIDPLAPATTEPASCLPRMRGDRPLEKGE